MREKANKFAASALPPIAWARNSLLLVLGLTPQALRLRLLRRLKADFSCKATQHQVKRWLEQDKGIAGVDLKVMAHSGATIIEDHEKDNDPKWLCMDGEINRSNPTITKQVSLAAQD